MNHNITPTAPVELNDFELDSVAGGQTRAIQRAAGAAVGGLVNANVVANINISDVIDVRVSDVAIVVLGGDVTQ